MILKVKDQLETLHQQINNGSTGTPVELAQRLGVTARTVHSYINQLCKMGAPIDYSRTNQTYYYIRPVEFKFGFEPLDERFNDTNGGGKRLVVNSIGLIAQLVFI
ncbi:MAG: HTH domain-containing protein [Tenuifilaceae bacterium]|jgi:biotin operon repressor|nr:HTH domain-containing protein [Tenuifilaceae bacterium]